MCPSGHSSHDQQVRQDLPGHLAVAGPESERARVLVRGDTGSGVHRVLEHIVSRGWQFSVGLYAHDPLALIVLNLPESAWEPAVDVDGDPREGADVAELTAYLPELRNPWPAGSRIIARREFPHAGARLRLTDVQGRRIQLFATNTVGSTLPELELRHRMRARAEDRIRGLRTPGCETCRCTASTPTRSGSRSCSSPQSCWSGPSTSHCTPAWPATGNPNDTAPTARRRRAPGPHRPP
ncbi:MAG: family transposase [Frankiales bacterium]|nr:family transposase [Frankiales bacterium]